jgi:hypothetical protein
VSCQSCGRPIEADARFCRFCGRSQADRPATAVGAAPPGSTTSRPARRATGDGLEHWLRQVFPRHHLQDEFMHVGSIAAFLMALIGFILGFFYNYGWLGTNFLLGSIALLLFLILRESTLSHIRVRAGESSNSPGAGSRYQAGRQSVAAADVPAEAATTQSSPPSAARPPTMPR